MMPAVSRRERIMQVAEKLFADKRLHEVTLDEIVRKARVGKGAVYAHFKDKDDLFFQVATNGFDELCGLLESCVSQEAPFQSQLLQACEAITAFFRRRRHLFRMIQTEDARMSLSRGSMQARWFARRKQLARSLGAIIARGRRAGLVRADIPDEVLAMLLLGLLRARARHLHDEGIEFDDRMLVSFFLQGAGTAGGSIAASAADQARQGEVYL